MIQRKQTLWLLLSLICAALTFNFAFYNGVAKKGITDVQGPILNANDNIWLTIFTYVVILASLAAILLFKNRRVQLQVTFAGLICSLVLLGLYFFFTTHFQSGSFAFTAIFSLGFVIGFLFAIRGIRDDEKLIRDLDRLR